MEGYSNSYDLHRIDEQLEDSKLKLLELHRECERTEIEMCGVSQLKDKGLFVQKSIERRYENVTEELKQVHRKYINCINKVNSQRGIDQQKINSLTLQRDNLKTELRQIKERVDENNRKFTEIKKMTTVQEVCLFKLIRPCSDWIIKVPF